MLFSLVAWVAFGLVAAPMARAQRFHLVVGGADFRPYPIAAPDLVTDGPAGTQQEQKRLADELNTLLRDYVALVRSLELVPVRTYLAPEKELWTQPVYSNWLNVGASGLIRGAVWTDGKVARVSFRLYDVVAQREVLSKTYTAQRQHADGVVRKFLDEVVLVLTGEPGILSSKIAYVKRTRSSKAIFVSDIDGRHARSVTNLSVLSLLPAWERSGKFLLFTSFLKGNSDLYRLQLRTNELEAISNREGLNTGAAVSPDGKKIALTLSLNGNSEIYVMDWDGKNLRRLTDSWGQDLSPTWSPDGKRIAFVSSRSGNPHIYVMNADGSQPRRLTFQGKYNQEPDWSPRTGGQIVFTGRDEHLKYDLFLVHPDTGVLTRLTQDEGNNEGPSFSPDGHHIAFTSTRGGAGAGRQLYVMDADGNNQRSISRGPGDYETPAWGPRLGYDHEESARIDVSMTQP